MTNALVPMIDATVANARHIPPATPKVAGYTTGADVAWTAAEWNLFPHAGKVRIEQDPPARWPLHADVLDVERGAAVPKDGPGWVGVRIAAGIEWSTIYASSDVLAATVDEFRKAGYSHYLGHVDAWLADWNLDEQEAAALIGTQVHGLTVRAVQWASPTSNPNTPVWGGGGATLGQALVDLSVAEAAWHAPDPLAPPRPSRLYAIDIASPSAAPTLLTLTSKDGGRTYS
jgi:hypothetical protein